MDILKQVKAWAATLAEVGVSLIALGIVLEILFKGQAIPFLSTGSIISTITAIIKGFSAEGLVGLVAIYVLYGIYNKK